MHNQQYPSQEISQMPREVELFWDPLPSLSRT